MGNPNESRNRNTNECPPSSDSVPKSSSKQLLCFSLIIILAATTTTSLGAAPPPSSSSQKQHGWDGVTITQSDFLALQSFKQYADPSLHSIFLSSWNGSRQSACSGSWVGIRCLKGRVIAIQLPFKGLSGQITPRVGQLTALRRLSLHDNFLGGSIPSSIGLLSNLRGLYLFNNRLSGWIPSSIGTLPNLQSLDLSANSLNGSFPPSLANATRLYRLNLSFNSISGEIEFNASPPPPSLAFLALQHNNLSGTIPSTWWEGGGVYRRLQVLTLDSNHLTGEIPASLGNLKSLNKLDLSNNNFTGELPDSLSVLADNNLTSFDVSYNDLSGQVPPALYRRFGSSSFRGNRHLQLCDGYYNGSSCPSVSSPAPSEAHSLPPSSSYNPTDIRHHKRKLSTKDIILILAGAILAVLLLLCCVLLCCLIRKRSRGGESKSNVKGINKSAEAGAAAATAGSGAATSVGSGGGKLVLFDGPFVFTAEDLLCATAEIMGKSAFGTVYKATMEDGNQVAVKRLREKLAKSPKEFEIEVGALGAVRHPNLLPLRAYYLGPKGEKLLVYDYLPKGTLSSYLHGRGPETVIDWPTRMKIAMGVTRGLLHLHSSSNEDNNNNMTTMMIHGNLTSAEIYLDDQTEPKISDYGLPRLMTDAANTNVISTTAGSTGYRAPELQKTKNPTAKSDIYSLGVILLELLTGKAPGESIDGVDLPQWVASTVKEEWTNEVFDVDLLGVTDVSRTSNNTTRDEMLNVLKLALHLVDPSPDARPDAVQVIMQLQEITSTSTADDDQSTGGGDHHDDNKKE